MKKNHIALFLMMIIVTLTLVSCSTEKPTAKNVIIIIGDGAGFNQLQAGSYYVHGEENALTAQKFPVTLAAATYPATGHGYNPDQVVANFEYLKEKYTDSAASGTALATGHKTYNGAIGVDTLKNPLTNIFEMAEAAGKATGVVTSVPFNHATPATFIAHNESRNNYHEIAAEMISESAVDVIIGCGHPFYDDNSHRQPEANYKYLSEATWNAVQEGAAGADADGDGQADAWTFVEFRQDFQNLGKGEAPKRLLGIPQVASTLQVNRAGAEEQTEPFFPPLTENIPRLDEMTKAAINVLDNDPDGFYLMIEAGAIDWACHGNNGPRMIEEVVDMENMVKAVVDWVEANSSWEETLVVVTADHETGYLTGPASGVVETESGEEKVVYQPIVNNGAGKMPGIEFHSGSHTNSLVPMLAKGTGAQGYLQMATQTDRQFGPYIDNTDIPNRIKEFLK